MEKYRPQEENLSNRELTPIDVDSTVKLWNQLSYAKQILNINDSRKEFPQEGYLIGDKMVAFAFFHKHPDKVKAGENRARAKAKKEGSYEAGEYLDEEYLRDYFNGIAAITVAESASEGEKRREIIIKLNGSQKFQCGVVDSLVATDPKLFPENTKELNKRYHRYSMGAQRLFLPVFPRPDMQHSSSYYEKLLEEKPLRDFREGEKEEIMHLVSKMGSFIFDRELN